MSGALRQTLLALSQWPAIALDSATNNLLALTVPSTGLLLATAGILWYRLALRA